MADNLLTPINALIHDTAQQIVDSGLTTTVAAVLKSVIDSSATAINNSLEKIKELTEES